MSKLIDAEEAKKALTGWDTDPTDEEIEFTIDSLPFVDSAEVAQKPLPVTERLPSWGDDRIMAFYLPRKRWDILDFSFVAGHPEQYSHWMPLPKSPLED